MLQLQLKKKQPFLVVFFWVLVGERFSDEHSGILSAEKLQPGQRFFIDHFEYTMIRQKFKGQDIKNRQNGMKVSNPSKSFKGGCIFIDAAAGLINIQF